MLSVSMSAPRSFGHGPEPHPVFHASRGNTAATGPGIAGSLDAARKHLCTVTGLDGRTIVSAMPMYPVAGPELETIAKKLLAAIYATTVDDVNAWAGRQPLVAALRRGGRITRFARKGSESMRNFSSYGDVIPVPSPSAVQSGEVVVIGTLVGVAAGDAAIGENLNLRVTGVF